MQYEEFIGKVRARTGIQSIDEAERATGATLETLGEHLKASERRDLSAQIPGGLKGALLGNLDKQRAEDFRLEEFYGRVGSRANLERSEAERLARAVIRTLQEALSQGEF